MGTDTVGICSCPPWCVTSRPPPLDVCGLFGAILLLFRISVRHSAAFPHVCPSTRLSHGCQILTQRAAASDTKFAPSEPVSKTSAVYIL